APNEGAASTVRTRQHANAATNKFLICLRVFTCPQATRLWRHETRRVFEGRTSFLPFARSIAPGGERSPQLAAVLRPEPVRSVKALSGDEKGVDRTTRTFGAPRRRRHPHLLGASYQPRDAGQVRLAARRRRAIRCRRRRGSRRSGIRGARVW